MEYGEADYSEKSQFNEGMFQIQRLNDSWRRCRECSVKNELENWALELEAVWRELSTDAKKLNKNYFKVIELLDTHIGLCWGTKENGEHSRIKPMMARRLLTKKEQILRQIQDESGKGAKYENPDANGLSF